MVFGKEAVSPKCWSRSREVQMGGLVQGGADRYTWDERGPIFGAKNPRILNDIPMNPQET